MTYKVDEGVPMPEIHFRGKPEKYPWGQLKEVGQSFFVPECDVPSRRIQNCKSSAEKRHEVKYMTRSVVEDGVKGTRVWRIK